MGDAEIGRWRNRPLAYFGLWLMAYAYGKGRKGQEECLRPVADVYWKC